MRAVALVTIALLAPALAHGYNGNELNQYLQANQRVIAGTADQQDFSDSSFLHGYIAAVADTVGRKSICAPKGTSYGQFVEIVRNFMKDNPQTWELSASAIAAAALAAVYPCQPVQQQEFQPPPQKTTPSPATI